MSSFNLNAKIFVPRELAQSKDKPSALSSLSRRLLSRIFSHCDNAAAVALRRSCRRLGKIYFKSVEWSGRGQTRLRRSLWYQGDLAVNYMRRDSVSHTLVSVRRRADSEGLCVAIRGEVTATNFALSLCVQNADLSQLAVKEVDLLGLAWAEPLLMTAGSGASRVQVCAYQQCGQLSRISLLHIKSGLSACFSLSEGSLAMTISSSFLSCSLPRESWGLASLDVREYILAEWFESTPRLGYLFLTCLPMFAVRLWKTAKTLGRVSTVGEKPRLAADTVRATHSGENLLTFRQRKNESVSSLVPDEIFDSIVAHCDFKPRLSLLSTCRGARSLLVSRYCALRDYTRLDGRRVTLEIQPLTSSHARLVAVIRGLGGESAFSERHYYSTAGTSAVHYEYSDAILAYSYERSAASPLTMDNLRAAGVDRVVMPMDAQWSRCKRVVDSYIVFSQESFTLHAMSALGSQIELRILPQRKWAALRVTGKRSLSVEIALSDSLHCCFRTLLSLANLIILNGKGRCDFASHSLRVAGAPALIADLVYVCEGV